MSTVMKGAEVAAAMKETLIHEVEQLQQQGVRPCLGMMRIGSRMEDLSYERGARKRMELTGIRCEVFELAQEVTQEAFEAAFCSMNENPDIHGILLFQPLPSQLDVEPIKSMIHPYKDVDGMSPMNVAKVFTGDDTGYAPCTAEAVMELLRHYQVDIQGKNVVVVGRSMVVGKPLSMLLLKEHATVTICHTRTKELSRICFDADILIAAAGKARMIQANMVGKHAVVADVGINVDEAGKLCGDVDYEALRDHEVYISPVPGGVGGVTSSVLAKHVIRAARHMSSN